MGRVVVVIVAVPLEEERDDAELRGREAEDEGEERHVHVGARAWHPFLVHHELGQVVDLVRLGLVLDVRVRRLGLGCWRWRVGKVGGNEREGETGMMSAPCRTRERQIRAQGEGRPESGRGRDGMHVHMAMLIIE